MQCSAAAKESEDKRIRNRGILLELIRSVYVLTKNRIPHTTTYGKLMKLLIANGDELLKHHTKEVRQVHNTPPLSQQQTYLKPLTLRLSDI